MSNPQSASPYPRRTPEQSSKSPSDRSARIFGITVAGGLSVVLLAVLIFALTGSPYRASIAMGGGMIALGIARGVWPGQPWFASRSRWSDVLVYSGVGVGIVLLAPLVALGAA